MSSLKENQPKVNDGLSSLFVKIGVVLICISLVIFFLTFYRVFWVELQYLIARPNKNIQVSLTAKKGVLTPVDNDFGIVIPKIAANAKVIPNVNPFNEREYQWQLTKGVAHAKGTAFPGQYGNVFIFAHSAGNFYDANRYNAIFYLLTKMEKGDKVDLFYKKHTYEYKVIEKKMVDATSVNYLVGNTRKRTVTLMTCWPAGTTYKRLLVIAELVEGSK